MLCKGFLEECEGETRALHSGETTQAPCSGDAKSLLGRIHPSTPLGQNCGNWPRESATQLSAWPRESAVTPQIRAPPPSEGCRHCAGGERGLQWDFTAVPTEPPDGTSPPPPQFGLLPRRVSKRAGSVLSHMAVRIGHGAFFSPPSPE